MSEETKLEKALDANTAIATSKATKTIAKTNNAVSKSENTGPNPTKTSQEDFVELKPFNGSGNYHVNHFIGYFKPPKEKFDYVKAIWSFYSNFDTIFSGRKGFPNEINVAKALFSEKKFKGKKTVKFTAAGNTENVAIKFGGNFHDDWVSIEMDGRNESFFATTLKREWLEPFEKIVRGTEAVSLIYNTPIKYLIICAGERSTYVNQHHFLAGRRSWRIGFDQKSNLCYIETISLERNSLIEYSVLEKTGFFREIINEIWINLIKNYAAFSGVELIKNTLINYSDIKANVYYKSAESENISDFLIGDTIAPWFSEVLQRHPGILAFKSNLR